MGRQHERDRPTSLPKWRQLSLALAGIAVAGVFALLSAAQLHTSTPTGPETQVRSLPPPPDASDPWKVAPAALPAPPRTDSTVSVPAAWQRLDDIGPVWADWLKGVPDATVITFPSGRYRTRDRLLVRERHDLVLRGPLSGPPAELIQVGDGTAFPYAPQRAVLMIHASERISVEHLTIIGANPRAAETDPMANPLEGQHGISVTIGCRDVRVADNDISNVYGDGISAQGDSVRTLIEGNRVRNVARQGISSLDAYDTTVRGNDIADVALDAVDVEPNRAGGRVLVVANRLGGKNPRLNASGPVLSDVTFADNVADGPLSVRIRAWPRPDGTWQRLERMSVIGNRGSRSPTDGRPEIEALNVDFLTVGTNRIQPPTATIWLIGSCPVRLSALHRDPATRWTVRFQAMPPSGSASEVAPTAVLSTPSDRLDPIPVLQHLSREITGREATAVELRTEAARICSGHQDRGELAVSKLAAWPDGPLATRARLAAIGVVTRGQVATSTATSGGSALTAMLDEPVLQRPDPLDGTGPLGRIARAADLPPPTGASTDPDRRAATAEALAREARAGSPFAAIHEVIVAYLVAADRLPTAAELLEWVPVALTTRPDPGALMRRITAARSRTLVSGASDGDCTSRAVEQRLMALAESPPLLLHRAGC